MVKQEVKAAGPSVSTQSAQTKSIKQVGAKKGLRPKHVPLRTCISCRTTGAKRGLLRLVRTTEGQVEIDETGKKAGRGAYLCRERECWDNGLAKKGLDNALKVTIDPETRARLRSYGEALPERSAVEVE